jgi:hypothetical protein
MKPGDVIKKKIEARRKKMPCGFCDKVFSDLGELLAHEDAHDGHPHADSDNPATAPKRNIPYRNK